MGEIMDGDTKIGFCHVSEKGYCKKCKKVFSYGYNEIHGLRKGEGNCPDCGAGDEWEDVVRSDFVDTSIMLSRGLIRSNITNDEQKENIRASIHEMNRIRRLFDEYDKGVK